MEKVKKIIFVHKELCPYCDRADALLKRFLEKNKDVLLEEHNYSNGLTKEEVSELVNAPHLITTLPQISFVFENEGEDELRYVGGYSDLVTFLEEEMKFDW